jgi:hypothetical protein
VLLIGGTTATKEIDSGGDALGFAVAAPGLGLGFRGKDDAGQQLLYIGLGSSFLACGPEENPARSDSSPVRPLEEEDDGWPPPVSGCRRCAARWAALGRFAGWAV